MQIDYICLSRVFLRIGAPFAEFWAWEFWYWVGPISIRLLYVHP